MFCICLKKLKSYELLVAEESYVNVSAAYQIITSFKLDAEVNSGHLNAALRGLDTLPSL